MATPDAWDDNWENAVDKPAETAKKQSSRITKAQRRAQQAEFNRQLWEEAEGPQEPNYFLEARGIVPRADFKPPPKLLSRKAPAGPAADGGNGDVSSDDGDGEKKKPTVEEQRALAVKEREEKQRKYEERRLELFGSTTTAAKTAGSGTSSPGETPPGSRSATPNRARGRGGRKTESNRPISANNSLSLKPSSIPPSSPAKKELFDPNSTPKPEPTFKRAESRENVIEPIRSPRGPDGSGRGGFGFAPRGGRDAPQATLET